MRYLIVLLLLLPMAASAADLSVSWVNATQQEDGTPIPATGNYALKDIVIEWGSCNADNTFNVKAGEKWFAMPATTGVLPGLADNNKYCLRGKSRNILNQMSTNFSNVVSKWVPPLVIPPKPPALSATVNVAWREYADGRFVLAGLVPMGTPCSDARTVEKYGVAFNPVDASAVTTFAGAKAPAGTYMAICGAS